MIQEYFLSGYCRALDHSRMVAVEIEDGEPVVDCDYGHCPYQSVCPIAIQINATSEN